MLQRIQKIMAHAGIASRRKCEELIRDGKVKVNGKTATIGQSADPGKDSIQVGSRTVKAEKKVYFILNKPKGIICSTMNAEGFPTVMSLIPTKERVFPVGRLDVYSEGLIILTNDGDFANKVIHPSFNVMKRYRMVLDRTIKDPDFKQLMRGVKIERKRVKIINPLNEGNIIEFSLHEGRKHIVRRVLDRLGYTVKRLKRTMIGNLALDLPEGACKEVSKEFLEKEIFGPGGFKEVNQPPKPGIVMPHAGKPVRSRFQRHGRNI